MTSPPKLSVNLNKVALLRNQRDVGYPSVQGVARTVLDAGAHGITIHPRPDERHIRRTDAYELGVLLKADYPTWVEYNIEGNPTESFLDMVLALKPTQVTLVPDSPEQSTSDHGWPLEEDAQFLQPIIERLKASNMRVALFVDPGSEIVTRAAALGVDRIELYTEPYAGAHARSEGQKILNAYVECADRATHLGLAVNAGHDLNLANLPAFCAALPQLAEVSIGHAITADALQMGFSDAVKAYLDILNQGK